MHRRDYIMNLVEEMTKAIGTVLFQHLQNKKHQEAFDLLESYFARLYLPKSKVLVGLSEPDLLSLFRTNDIIETDKMAAASLLLSEEARVCRDWQREEEAYRLYATALLLRCEAALHDERGTPADHAEQIEGLLGALNPYHLPFRNLLKLFAYYENTARYDQAENTLYRLLSAPVPQQEKLYAGELGKSFYERLLEQPDEQLAAGGLPRVEVEEGLHSLLARLALLS